MVNGEFFLKVFTVDRKVECRETDLIHCKSTFPTTLYIKIKTPVHVSTFKTIPSFTLAYNPQSMTRDKTLLRCTREKREGEDPLRRNKVPSGLKFLEKVEPDPLLSFEIILMYFFMTVFILTNVCKTLPSTKLVSVVVE